MAEWTWKAFDLATGTYLRDVPMRSWGSTDPLNENGQFSASFGVPEDVAETQSLRESTNPARTIMVAFRDGSLVFDGIIWRRLYDSQQRVVTLAGRQLGSFWDHFDIPADLTFAQVDQLAIWRTLLAGPGLNYPNADLGLNVDATLSGVLRDRTYWRHEVKRYGEAMQQLAAVNGGFDWHIGVEVSGDLLTRAARLWYPRRGVSTTFTNLTFRTDVSATLAAIAEDGSELADTVTAVGSGQGAETLLAVATGTALSAVGYPGYSRSIAYKDVKTTDVLATYAEEERLRSSRVELDNFAVRVDPRYEDQPWGSWGLGDDATIVLADDPWYPRTTGGEPGLVVERRIVAHQWAWNQGAETLTLGLVKRPGS